MKVLGVIPARYGSTRFEGKPLADICGNTMIEWVYKRAIQSDLDKIVVATDDERIYNEVLRFNGEAVMTSENHNTGTDRIAETAKLYKEYDVIINIQGDEPLIEPVLINNLAKAFKDVEVLMATLKHKISDEKDIANPNVVKVITDIKDNALYFSRSPIPYNRDKKNIIDYYRHIGIYGYRRDFLFKYAEMQPTNLEKTESLEQLRVLENGYNIKVIETEFSVKGVDTKEDLLELINYINQNKITLI